MAWAVELLKSAAEDLHKLDPAIQERIRKFLYQRLSRLDNPQQIGKALRGNHAGLWRYRVGDYRLICQIEDTKLTILVIKIGHRKNIY